jgi:hypothetical protein
VATLSPLRRAASGRVKDSASRIGAGRSSGRRFRRVAVFGKAKVAPHDAQRAEVPRRASGMGLGKTGKNPVTINWCGNYRGNYSDDLRRPGAAQFTAPDAATAKDHARSNARSDTPKPS